MRAQAEIGLAVLVFMVRCNSSDAIAQTAVEIG